MHIDLNSDVGESYGAWSMGQDDALMPLVTSANIACGAHAGDPVVMARTIRLAAAHGVAIGAQPGYPDRDGFGRRDLAMTPEELASSLLAQLGALAAIARSEVGAELRHVKPHGALYNRAARDPALAETIARTVARFSRDVVLVGLAGSALVDAGRDAGLAIAAEAFADRAYEADGSLRARGLPGAVLESPDEAARQARTIVVDGLVRAHDGSVVEVRADTLCIHGDTPDAPAYARQVRETLAADGVAIAPVGRA